MIRRASALLLALGLACDSRSKRAPADDHAGERAAAGAVPPPHPSPILVPGGSAIAGEHVCQLLEGKTNPPALPIEPFRIDFAAVTCAEWRECVVAGACLPDGVEAWEDKDPEAPGWPLGWCVYGAANVSQSQADAFCRWRGGELPSWAQWQHAMRGNRSTTRVEPEECRTPRDPHRHHDHPYDRPECELVSSYGVSFILKNWNFVERTRDRWCGNPEKFLAVSTLPLELGKFSTSDGDVEFRCVYPAQPK